MSKIFLDDVWFSLVHKNEYQSRISLDLYSLAKSVNELFTNYTTSNELMYQIIDWYISCVNGGQDVSPPRPIN